MKIYLKLIHRVLILLMIIEAKIKYVDSRYLPTRSKDAVEDMRTLFHAIKEGRVNFSNRNSPIYSESSMRRNEFLEEANPIGFGQGLEVDPLQNMLFLDHKGRRYTCQNGVWGLVIECICHLTYRSRFKSNNDRVFGSQLDGSMLRGYIEYQKLLRKISAFNINKK
ncbi:uncharacterized protein LOC135922093 isoform X2 [Gordionus sp. m RMFG-2023]|uniref:uncharacterized protein LOC135922093 isoform X2 n=1 Tax=Gordionus sp. m RMFG-2023 TaxID=3053472 RepID=UPI0031FCF107